MVKNGLFCCYILNEIANNANLQQTSCFYGEKSILKALTIKCGNNALRAKNPRTLVIGIITVAESDLKVAEGFASCDDLERNFKDGYGYH